MLPRYNIHNSIPFSFKHSSSDSRVATLADELFENLPIDKTKNIDLKRKCLKSILVNLYLGWLSMNYIRYSRKKDYYAKLPKRYKPEYFTWTNMSGIMSCLEEQGLIDSELGFYNPLDEYGSLTKVKASDSFLSDLLSSTLIEIEDVSPLELVVLKDRASKAKKDYNESKKTQNMRTDLLSYNTLRQRTRFTLEGVSKNLLTDKTLFLNLYAKGNTSGGVITLRNPYIYRVFNDNFLHGGRYYSGIESNMPSELRKHLKINSQDTTELDYSCLHIRILYNQEGLPLIENAYDQLAEDDLKLRALYKLIGLVSINAGTLKSALNSIRNELRKSSGKYFRLEDLSDKSIMKYYQKWTDHHAPIKKYLNADIGIKLQYYDSKIASGVVKHFTAKDVPVLVVHDSFVIEKKHEADLRAVMVKEYEKIFKFEPVIK